jgi:hypothetical protein
MKSNPAAPGGQLTSKPTWSNTSGCSATSAFFVLVGRRRPDKRSFHREAQRHVNNQMASFGHNVAGDEGSMIKWFREKKGEKGNQPKQIDQGSGSI